MKNLISLDDVNTKVITIRNQNVILDSDVAILYGVETKRVNEAVRNNLDKFPDGYVFELSKQEWHNLRALIIASSSKSERFGHVVETFDHMSKNDSKSGSYLKSHATPKAFTEKGLYMLATVLKSPQATQTTIAIIEAFTKIRELSRAVVELAQVPDDEQKQMAIMQKSGAILSDIIQNDLKTTSTETSFELNLLAMLKLKHTIKREAE